MLTPASLGAGLGQQLVSTVAVSSTHLPMPQPLISTIECISGCWHYLPIPSAHGDTTVHMSIRFRYCCPQAANVVHRLPMLSTVDTQTVKAYYAPFLSPLSSLSWLTMFNPVAIILRSCPRQGHDTPMSLG